MALSVALGQVSVHLGHLDRCALESLLALSVALGQVCTWGTWTGEHLWGTCHHAWHLGEPCEFGVCLLPPRPGK